MRSPRSTTAEQECCVLSRLKLITEDLVAREGVFVHFPFMRNLLNNFTNFKTPHSPFEFILSCSSLDCREDITHLYINAHPCSSKAGLPFLPSRYVGIDYPSFISVWHFGTCRDCSHCTVSFVLANHLKGERLSIHSVHRLCEVILLRN